MTQQQTQQAVAPRAPFDSNQLNATMRSGGTGVAAFAPTDFSGMLEVAKMMAASGVAIPKHLRQSAGMCLSVAMVAYQNGFNPFLLAADTYVVNDVLAYGAKSIAAMVNNSPRLDGRLHYELSGAWPKRVCTVSGKIVGDERPKVLPVQAETITTRNSPLWKQQPDQQLIYFATRAWSRVYMPEVLLGLLDNDEAAAPVDQPTDITPATARPTRADFQAGGPVIEAEVEDVVEEQLFAFVTVDGEELSMNAAGFGEAFKQALEDAATLAVADGIWETNSPALQMLREHDAAEADLIHKAYDLAQARLKPKQTGRPDPLLAKIAVAQTLEALQTIWLNAPDEPTEAQQTAYEHRRAALSGQQGLDV